MHQDIDPIPTCLKIQRYTSWYALAFVTTSLQIQAQDLELAHSNSCKTVNTIEDINLGTLGTLLLANNNQLVSRNVETALTLIKEADNFDDDILIKPNYIKEFRIRVKTLKIDKSFPKISF